MGFVKVPSSSLRSTSSSVGSRYLAFKRQKWPALFGLFAIMHASTVLLKSYDEPYIPDFVEKILGKGFSTIVPLYRIVLFHSIENNWRTITTTTIDNNNNNYNNDNDEEIRNRIRLYIFSRLFYPQDRSRFQVRQHLRSRLDLAFSSESRTSLEWRRLSGYYLAIVGWLSSGSPAGGRQMFRGDPIRRPPKRCATINHQTICHPPECSRDGCRSKTHATLGRLQPFRETVQVSICLDGWYRDFIVSCDRTFFQRAWPNTIFYLSYAKQNVCTCVRV